jgi:hypothetical protein
MNKIENSIQELFKEAMNEEPLFQIKINGKKISYIKPLQIKTNSNKEVKNVQKIFNNCFDNYGHDSDDKMLKKANKFCENLDNAQKESHWYFDSNSIFFDGKWIVEVIVKPGYKKFFPPVFDGVYIKVIEDDSLFKK